MTYMTFFIWIAIYFVVRQIYMDIIWVLDNKRWEADARRNRDEYIDRRLSDMTTDLYKRGRK